MASPAILEMNSILGLDTASNRLAWACTDALPIWPHVLSNGELSKHGEFIAEDHGNKDAQRIELYDTAHQLFRVFVTLGAEEHKACHVFCEEPLALQNGKTTRLLGLAAGAIWAAHREYNLWWHWVDVAHWKKEVVGKGNASKEDIKAFCLGNPAFKRELPIQALSQDVYDAWCLKVHGVRFITISASAEGA